MGAKDVQKFINSKQHPVECSLRAGCLCIEETITQKIILIPPYWVERARKILSVVAEKITQGDLTEDCWRGE